MYKYLILFSISLVQFCYKSYAMKAEMAIEKNIPENPEIERKPDYEKHEQGRNPFEITEFKVGDIIDSRDERLRIEIDKSYSDNRQNRIHIENFKKTISKHLFLKCEVIMENNVKFGIYHINDINNSIGNIELKIESIKKTILIHSLSSNKKGYGLAALQLLMICFETNKNLYNQIDSFYLDDGNYSIDGEKKIINLYERVGFATSDVLSRINNNNFSKQTNNLVDERNDLDHKMQELLLQKEKLVMEKNSLNRHLNKAELEEDYDDASKKIKAIKSKINLLDEKINEFEKLIHGKQEQIKNINIGVHKKANRLYRPRFLNDEKWQREGSVDKNRDALETPYWKKQPIKY